MEVLAAFRSAVSNGTDDFQLLNSQGSVVSSLADATDLKINTSGQQWSLDTKTAFESANSELGRIDLKTIVNCWQCRELSVPQYIASSEKLGIPNLKFLERTDLIDWLDGSSDESEYIKSGAQDESKAQGDVAMPDADAGLPDADVDRGVLVNHSTILRGQKLNDFSNVAALGHKQLISEYRAASAGRPSSSAGGSSRTGTPSAAGGGGGGATAASLTTPLKPAKGKDPIILLSPSPSSLLNMANVQTFLEKGSFTPVLKSANSPNLLRITRNSKVIGPKTKFVVVDSVDQFKPDYWDRVVAIFVTGQSWQLRSYKWNDPNSLFQHVLGFGLVYKNDPIPESLKQWNVKIEPLDRIQRFRDREVVERIWERIEAHMIARGWPITRTA